MTPQEKAARGLELIEQSIVECLEQARGKVGQSVLGRELGLLQDGNKFTRTLVRSVAEKLASEGHICAETTVKPMSRVYFLRDNQAH